VFSKPRNFHFHSISSDKPNLSYSWLQTQLASSKFEATISKTSLRTQKETHELEKAKMTITVNNAVKDAEQRLANEFDLERTTLKNELLEMKAENLALKNSINHPYGFCICCTEPLQKDGIISRTCGHTGLCTRVDKGGGAGTRIRVPAGTTTLLNFFGIGQTIKYF
jgi:RNA polymerase-binding transcription factor DksA